MNTKLFTILLFLATYVLLIALPKYRAWVAIGSALIFIVSGIMRIGVPFTLIAVLCGYLYCWFVWARA